MLVKTHTKASVGLVVRTYARQLRNRPLLLVLIALSTIALQAVTLIGPLYMRELFNMLVASTPSEAAVHILYGILGVVVALWGIDWISRRIQGFANTRMQSNILTALQTEAFEYLMGHSNNFFTSNFAGSLTHKVKRYSGSFEQIFDSIIYQFAPTIIFITGAVSILFYHNHWLGLLLGVWSVCFIAFQIYVARIRQPIRVARAAADTHITATLSDAISNQSTVALFAAGVHERGLFKQAVSDWRTKTLRLWDIDELIWSGIGLFNILLQTAMIGGAIYFWSKGELTIGDFVLIQSYLFTTFDRLVGINRDLRSLFSALADASEMVEILQTPHEVQDAPNAKKLQVEKGAIAFTDVEFYFHSEKGVLHNFNLTIDGGQKVALVGPSGAGKSTITKLLLRLFDVKAGTIEIDGQNIAQVTQDSLRETISFVPQEPILFHRTLMENIRYGRLDATDAEVIEAAKQAHCHEFISQLPQGYETFVGERGIKLSGGERQRVAIARAILKNAPILVLDEATSSLDSESEALIQDALATLMEGKTVIVIAHRLSTIMKMDRIIVLQQGAIVADGTHDELLAKGGLYQKLWNIQAGGFLVET